MTNVEITVCAGAAAAACSRTSWCSSGFLHAHAALLEGRAPRRFQDTARLQRRRARGLVSGARMPAIPRSARWSNCLRIVKARNSPGETPWVHEKGHAFLREGQSIEFPMLSGSVGPEVVDIRTLYAKTGLFTSTPGPVTATAARKSPISTATRACCSYRGYPIEQLACASAIFSRLLPAAERRAGRTRAEGGVRQYRHHHTMVPNMLAGLSTGFARDSHPMGPLTVGVVGCAVRPSTRLARHQQCLQREISAAWRLQSAGQIVASIRHRF